MNETVLQCGRTDVPTVARKIRIGVFAADMFPHWLGLFRAEAMREDDAEIIAVRLKSVLPVPASKRNSALLRLWIHADQLWFGSRDEQPGDDAEIFSLTLNAAEADASKQIADLGCDVCFAADEPARRWLATKADRFWCFSDSASSMSCMLQNLETIEIELREVGGEVERTIAVGSASADATSMERQDRNIGLRRAHLLARAVREHRMGLVPCPDQPEQKPECSEMAVLRTIARRAVAGLRRNVQRALTREQWFIATETVAPEEAGNAKTSFLIPPRDRFYADPFPFERNGRTYIFFEELRFADGKGRISVVEVNQDGTFSEPRVVLETGFHLSYPNIFNWGEEVYMLPEMSAAGEQRVFRATDFPHRWEPDHVLLDDVRLADPTLHEQDGRWWLFGSGVRPQGDMNSELHLFYAESPLGPWKSHPRNPIVSDVRRARPAGRIFRQRNSFIRPGQDCASQYGAGISLCRIDAVTPTDYRETVVGRIGPEWMPGNLGTHTVNNSSSCRVWDGRVRIVKYARVGGAPQRHTPQSSALLLGDYA